MKLRSFLLIAFTEKEPDPEHSITVPFGSNLVCGKVVHEGIHLWYEVPEVVTEVIRTDVFKIVKPEESIPEGYRVFDILDTIVEDQGAQQIIVFPIYRKLPSPEQMLSITKN